MFIRKILVKLISSRKPVALLAFGAMRGGAIIRGWFLRQYLVFVWGARVGSGLLCFGWPREVILLGDCEIGDDVLIGRYAYLESGEGALLRIGPRALIGDFATITAQERIVIGGDVMIAESVGIRDFDHEYRGLDRPMHAQGIVTTPIDIGEDVWIGHGVAILRGSELGKGCIIGAHAVVKGKIESYAVAVGAPARKINSRVSETGSSVSRT